MSNAPTRSGRPRWPIEYAAQTLRVSVDALQFTIAKPRTRGRRRSILSDAEFYDLLRPQLTLGVMAKRLEMSDYSVRHFMTQLGLVSTDGLYPPSSLAEVWDATVSLRAVSLIDDDVVLLSVACTSLRTTRTLLRGVVRRYNLPYGPIEYRRRSLNATTVSACIKRDNFERIALWYSRYAPYGWHSVEELSSLTGLSESRIRNYFRMAGVRGVTYRNAEAGIWSKHYQLEALADLVGDVAQPEWLSATEIADLLRRSNQWVSAHVDRTKGEIRLSKLGRLLTCYPPTEVQRLRQMSLWPPGGDWLTTPALARKLDRDKGWVQRHATGSQIRLADSGTPTAHYPPTELERLRNVVRDAPKSAGNWQTILSISKAIRKSTVWVESRIDLSLGEPRLTGNGNTRTHYPPSELTRLRRLARETRKAGNWLTVKGIAAKLGRSGEWVRSRIDQTVGEERIDKSGRKQIHYPRTELVRLRELDSQTPEHGGWLTIQAIRLELGRAHSWVNKRINHELAQDRKDPSGNVFPHYPPSELERLRQLSEGVPDHDGWVTTGTIVAELGKSALWVNHRLNPALGEQRRSAQGRVHTYYPPSELERLRANINDDRRGRKPPT